MKFYHATTQKNARGILKDGRINADCFGFVFLCDNPKDACKFLAVRFEKYASVFEVELNEDDVEESYDHSEDFFHCKAYVYHGDIELDDDVRLYEYKMDF